MTSDEGLRVSDVECPFCGDDGFDLIGLKIHLINYCDKYGSLSLEEGAS